MKLLKWHFGDKFELKSPQLKAKSFDEQMLLLKSGYRCARDIKYCDSQVLLDAFYIGPITSDELNNTDYIEYASNMMIKYFSDPKTKILHDIEVLAKWKKENLDQYNEATSSLLQRRKYLESNNFKAHMRNKQAKRHRIIKERESKGIYGDAAD